MERAITSDCRVIWETETAVIRPRFARGSHQQSKGEPFQKARIRSEKRQAGYMQHHGQNRCDEIAYIALAEARVRFCLVTLGVALGMLFLLMIGVLLKLLWFEWR
jgi:hypothetical protein